MRGGDVMMAEVKRMLSAWWIRKRARNDARARLKQRMRELLEPPRSLLEPSGQAEIR